jgi:hypothetical protein
MLRIRHTSRCVRGHGIACLRSCAPPALMTRALGAPASSQPVSRRPRRLLQGLAEDGSWLPLSADSVVLGAGDVLVVTLDRSGQQQGAGLAVQPRFGARIVSGPGGGIARQDVLPPLPLLPPLIT